METLNSPTLAGPATLDAASIAAAAAALDHAEQTRRQLGQFSLAHSGMTIVDAYAIQRAWVGLKIARGRRVRGHKIGLTSRAMQQSSQIDEPDYGVLLDDMFSGASSFQGWRSSSRSCFPGGSRARSALWRMP